MGHFSASYRRSPFKQQYVTTVSALYMIKHAESYKVVEEET